MQATMYNYRENIPDASRLFNLLRESHEQTDWEGSNLTQTINETHLLAGNVSRVLAGLLMAPSGFKMNRYMLEWVTAGGEENPLTETYLLVHLSWVSFCKVAV